MRSSTFRCFVFGSDSSALIFTIVPPNPVVDLVYRLPKGATIQECYETGHEIGSSVMRGDLAGARNRCRVVARMASQGCVEQEIRE